MRKYCQSAALRASSIRNSARSTGYRTTVGIRTGLVCEVLHLPMSPPEPGLERMQPSMGSQEKSKDQVEKGQAQGQACQKSCLDSSVQQETTGMRGRKLGPLRTEDQDQEGPSTVTDLENTRCSIQRTYPPSRRKCTTEKQPGGMELEYNIVGLEKTRVKSLRYSVGCCRVNTFVKRQGGNGEEGIRKGGREEEGRKSKGKKGKGNKR
ncbi:hypothetical protein CC1G_15064 [Coprinopsis cinerea okayama7|uniref:Uncharacterized protein n=1 Tax=Coprinopsis cinerea (strain Okayama-7 / 130 / ATCC MYA-4618 / FGSC 9003) TaxID=240176 RepID=D6RP78_COPC7|nr:hypothetical protein CC1G_15064 [Coprinopsis cinerea okayama7\|eukprot:XP_002910730.1 hypothetical protein CC1G_15064 [Coprinopsis cinerea okayama7\